MQTINGMAFDLSSPHGRMLATFLSSIAEFERDLISERVKSGLAAAKARGKKLGRQTRERPKSDRIAPKVMAVGRSYRWIARDLGISKNTVNDIMRRTNLQRASDAELGDPDFWWISEQPQSATLFVAQRCVACGGASLLATVFEGRGQPETQLQPAISAPIRR